MRKTWLGALLVFMWAGIAAGQLTDYQLQISCSGGGCSTGIGTGSIAGEVNGLTGNTVTVLENGNGSPSVIDPVLLIIGVPNPPAGYTPPNITAINGVSVTPYGPGLAGGAWGWSGSGAATNFVSGESDAYAEVGLGSGKTGAASESFGNWSTANAQDGLSTSSFSLYVYALSGTNLSGGHTYTASFSNLTNGTFIIGYSCSVGLTSNPCTMQGDNMGGTPFTVSGEIVQAPEPTTLALLGTTGILGLAGMFRRKFRV